MAFDWLQDWFRLIGHVGSLKGSASSRKRTLIGLACLGYPRPLSRPIITELADLLAAEGGADPARLAELARLVREKWPSTVDLSRITLPYTEALALASLSSRANPDSLVECLNHLCGQLTSDAVPHHTSLPWCSVARWEACVREVMGPDPEFRAPAFNPAWRTTDATLLARGIHEERAFDRMSILADALQDAGCDNGEVLAHCRDAGAAHVRGCWVVDLVLNKS